MSTIPKDLMRHVEGDPWRQGRELPQVEEMSAMSDTFGGRVHLQWAAAAPVTLMGQLPFFIDFFEGGRTVRCLGRRLPVAAEQLQRAGPARRARNTG